jgi:hypothetical protein
VISDNSGWFKLAIGALVSLTTTVL